MHYIIIFFQHAIYGFLHKTNYMLDVARSSSAQQVKFFEYLKDNLKRERTQKRQNEWIPRV